jgi:NTP pyrophosphatase (non-canonical NTP hydrolase)
MGELQEMIHKTAHEKGWYAEPLHTTHADVDIPEKIVLIISEAIEALEDARRTDRDVLRVYDHDGAPEGFPIELADVVIRTMDLAGALNIDIEAAVMQKMAYNNHRDWRHGNKRF